jgi:predicted RecB family nuclease
LIGIRVQAAEGSVQHSFWADDSREEKLIWNDFLGVLSEIIDPHLIHYGSYETIFLKRMCQRQEALKVLRPPHRSATNSFLSSTPRSISTFNGLKEITGYLGFRWSGSLTSGLETIVWRHRWEASRAPAVKQALLDYNRQDGEALELVANSLVDLHRGAPADGKLLQKEVILTSNLKRESPYGFGRNEFAFPEDGDHH